MADAEKLTCWDSEDVFTIGIRLKTLGGQFHVDDEEPVELDTGYGGDLLVPWEMYTALELYGWEYPEEHWSVGISVSGERFEMPLSQGILVIPRLGREFEVLIDTFEGNEQFLIGRGFIRKHRILLDGPGNRVCFFAETD
ncbi:MAG: hypothetical protein A2Z04_01665 [Chloroflexi bacterium RBG_16_57_9]|nr:MAG: hypothetical protein A2Z04_01665 [Chloroflexi bacterium RBG_16_57_9]